MIDRCDALARAIIADGKANSTRARSMLWFDYGRG
jgi:hypothetical protein